MSTEIIPKAESAAQKPKRPKVDHACVYCRRSHMTCDHQRPCSRCIKRSIGHLCRDEPRQKKDGKRGSTPTSQGVATMHSVSPSTNDNLLRPSGSGPGLGLGAISSGGNPKQQTQPPTVNNNLGPGPGNWDFDSLNSGRSVAATTGNGNNNGITSNPAPTFNVPFNQNPVFFSEHAGSEFSSLNDFLSIIDEPNLMPDVFDLDLSNPDNDMDRTDASMGPQQLNTALNANSNAGSGTTAGPVTNISGGTGSAGPESEKDKFFLTAADPSEDVSPEVRLKQVIQAKLKAGLLQPFNYVNGYQRLQKYMDTHMNQSSKQRILKPLSTFRPTFRAVAGSLSDVDLVLVEEAFERMLLDYDRVFTSMAIPACLWRRTGEIYRGNREFAGLVEVDVEDLRDGKLAIYELMSEESAVNYWEKYGNIAFDSGQKAVLTSCNLRTRDGRKRRACCFSFTIRRDRYNIPSCIIGNFIPIHS